jgi:hypothetical protein
MAGISRRRDASSHGLGRLSLLLGLVLVSFFAWVASASAGEPPLLSKLSVSPPSINTTASSQTVAVSAEITSVAGSTGGSVQFESPTEADKTERVTLSKVSGTASKGTWEAIVPFKRYIAPGTWRISTLNLNDSEGNQVKLSSSQLEAKGFAHTVAVTSTEDNEPPQLAGLSFSASSVNVTGGPQTVAVTAHITDNLSGFASGSIVFRSPSGKHVTEAASFTKVSGTEMNGTYEAKVTFKRYIEPGAWKVTALHMVDNVENETTLVARKLQAKGLPETIQVESVEDEQPPTLAGFSISPSSVNVSSAEQTVTVGAHITDALSGFAKGSVTFESPSGKQVTNEAQFTKVSGTEQDGTYEATVTFNKFIQSGSWKVRAVNLTDNVGNSAKVTAPELEGKGLPDTVSVTSTEDTAAPGLGSLAFSSASVNTTSSVQSVTVTGEITDNLSGFAHGTIVFESPNGKVLTNVASFSKVSGTATKGIYEAKVTFKQFVQAGTWKVSNVNLVDAVGNEVNISASGLEGKGFPAAVKVESSEDIEAPVLKELTITPKTINTASTNEVVIVTAHVSDNLSGFHTGFIGFESENGKHQTGQATFNARLSGTETDGTYEAVVNFKQTPESGTWKVSNLTLIDNAGNEASLSASQLQAKGFPASVVDETGAPPSVRKVNPKKGPAAGATAVRITGTNFAGVTAVKFGAKEAVGFTVNSLNSITATSPAGSTGKVDITVTTANGTSAINSKDHFTYGSPTITGLSPAHGPASGGTEVTVTGTGFEAGKSGTAFKFGKAMGTSVNCSSKATCTVTSPAGANGPVNVIAIVAGKKSSKTITDQFTYT